MALQLDTSRPFRSRSQVEELLRAVLAADPADETEWLEWKSRLDLSKSSRVLMVAKEVLGLANRSVEKASRFCEGVSYVVVGAAANGELHGVEEVDLATVEQMLDSYVGSGKGAPTYSMDYHHIDGKRVLLITVEAPRPGDHIFTLRRAGSLEGGSQCEEGTIFVRTGSSTVRASSALIRSLEERLVAGTVPAPPPVSFEFAGSLPMEWYDLEAAEGAVRSWADDCAERMVTKAEQLEASRRPPPRELDLTGWGTLGAAFSSVAPLLDGSSLSAAGLVGQTPDRRSLAAFCTEVDEWKERATAAAMRRVEGRFRHEHGTLSVIVRNTGDRFLEDVAIEVTLEPYATVVAYLEEPPAVPFPPHEFGKPTSLLATAMAGIAYPRAAIGAPRIRPTVEADGNRAVFHIGNLRQGGEKASRAVSVVVPRLPQPPALTARWVVSARNAGISSGETTIPVAIEPVEVDALVEAAVCNDPED